MFLWNFDYSDYSVANEFGDNKQKSLQDACAWIWEPILANVKFHVAY